MLASPVNRLLYPLFIAAMALIVGASNILVQYPVNDWLTWGAFTYPISFLITDLANRRLGASNAVRVVFCGFAVGVVLSAYLATPRIALASGSAFLVAHLIDVYVFHRLRKFLWWVPPLISSLIASALDTLVFFSLAFAMSGLPWVTWAIGDFAVKVLVALLMLIPFRLLYASMAPREPEPTPRRRS